MIRSRCSSHALALAWAAAAAVACGEPTGSSGLTAVTIRHCKGTNPPLTPATLEYRNEGDTAWRTVPGDDGVFTLHVSPRLLLRHGGAVIALTAAELAEFQCEQRDMWSKVVVGNVRNLWMGAHWNAVPSTGMGRQTVRFGGGDSIYTAAVPGNGPVDMFFSVQDSIPRAVWIRREVMVPANDTIPAWDPLGDEAHAFERAPLTVVGATIDDFFPQVFFRSGLVSSRVYGGAGMYGAVGVRPRLDTVYMVPDALMREHEYHQYTVARRDGSEVLDYYFRTTPPSVVTVGLSLAAVAFSRSTTPATCGSASAVRVATYDIGVPSQAELPSFVRFQIAHHPQSHERTDIWITSAYLGARPDTWRLTIPGEFASTGVSIPCSGTDSATVTVTAGRGRLAVLLGGAAPRHAEEVHVVSATATLP